MKKIILFLAAALLIVGCGTKNAQKEATLENPYMDFTGYTPEGDAISLSDVIGQTDYVLVDFWASWCGPCRRLIPVLKEMYGRMPEGRLQIVSCSLDQEEEAWLQALAAEQMPWIQMHDDENFAGAEMYGVEFIPHSVLIDRRGEIIGVNLDEAEMEEILMK